MSANIYWEPASARENSLDAGAPQWFMECLEEIGWHRGSCLDETALPALRAMRKATAEGNRTPFTQLIEAIEKHGEVRIWAEY